MSGRLVTAPAGFLFFLSLFLFRSQRKHRTWQSARVLDHSNHGVDSTLRHGDATHRRIGRLYGSGQPDEPIGPPHDRWRGTERHTNTPNGPPSGAFSCKPGGKNSIPRTRKGSPSSWAFAACSWTCAAMSNCSTSINRPTHGRQTRGHERKKAQWDGAKWSQAERSFTGARALQWPRDAAPRRAWPRQPAGSGH